jgi:hypothetical protein
MSTLNFPKRGSATPSTDVLWIPQGSPIGAKNLSVDSIAIGPPHKIGCITGITHELAAASDGQRIINMMVHEDIDSSLDSSFMSSNPATADRPAGFLAGLTTLGATAGGGESAMLGDFEKIGSSIASAGCNGDDIIYILSSKQFVSARLRLGTNRPIQIFSSPNLPAGTVVGLHPKSLILALGQLRVEVTSEPTITFQTQPDQLSSGGVMAAGTTMSAFQVDLILIIRPGGLSH